MTPGIASTLVSEVDPTFGTRVETSLNAQVDSNFEYIFTPKEFLNNAKSKPKRIILHQANKMTALRNTEEIPATMQIDSEKQIQNLFNYEFKERELRF